MNLKELKRTVKLATEINDIVTIDRDYLCAIDKHEQSLNDPKTDTMIRVQLPLMARDNLGVDPININTEKLLTFLNKTKHEWLDFGIHDNKLIGSNGSSTFSFILNTDTPTNTYTWNSWNNCQEIETQLFKKALQPADKIIVKNEIRIPLQSALITNENIISCNGNTLAVTPLEWKKTKIYELTKLNVDNIMLHNQYINIILKYFKNDSYIRVEQNDTHTQISCQDITLKILNQDMKYPDYKRVLPSTLNGSFCIEKKDMIEKLKEIESIAKKQANTIKVEITNTKIEMKYEDIYESKVYIQNRIGTNVIAQVNYEKLLTLLELLDEDLILIKYKEIKTPEFNWISLLEIQDSSNYFILIPIRY